MNNKIINIGMFLTGAAIGTAVTWKYFKTKYEQITKDEIASVKAAFSNKKNVVTEEVEEKVLEKKVDPEMGDYESVIEETGYNPSNIENKGVSMRKDHIYVIPPESVGDLDYEIASLTYYADEVLTNDRDEVIKDIDDLIGLESLNHFGEFEDDSVYVRNDKLKTDFEILRDMRNYADVISKPSHPVKNDQCDTE